MGLDHGVEIEENREASETVQDSSDASSGADFGTAVSQMVYTGESTAPAAGPTYADTGSSHKTVASNHATTTTVIYRSPSTEPHARIITPYRLRITLEADDSPAPDAPVALRDAPSERTVSNADRFLGRWRIFEEHDAGELREDIPLSLMGPVPIGPPLSDYPLPAPARTDGPGRDAPAGTLPARRPGQELLVRYGDGVERPFTFPETGFHARGIVGLENIRAANDLALTKVVRRGLLPRGPGGRGRPRTAVVDGLLQRAKRTGLTRLGTGSAQALEDGTSYVALSASTPRPWRPAPTRWRG